MSTNKKKVLIVGPIHEHGMALLEGRDDITVEVIDTLDPEVIKRHAADAHGIGVRVAQINRLVIDNAPNLQVVSRHGVGYDSVDQDALTERKIPLCIAPRSNAPSVAEQAMMFMLVHAKQMHVLDPMVRANTWNRRSEVEAFDLAGRTLLICGLGRIGSRLAKRALAFDMKVFGYDPYIDPEKIRAMGVEPVADFHTVLGECHMVSVHCPRNKETIGLIGKKELDALPAGALVINCARGGIVDEPALLDAVKSGHLVGAGLDVFDVEPAMDHPFFSEKNILMTPHSAGMSLEARQRSSYQTVENILAVFDGTLDPDVVVNKEVLG
ncbi:hydroxyacid dehydrogenase [Thalassobaculum salexigens]|uniref:hydroxyacid dehydrogenase n=1 Tax=Thalassobaculum salexigens TaxID=455360 RepID=UPI00041CD6A2|nr:hydroxyacid dehydrogenase [Thalassobaculum salexigens]